MMKKLARNVAYATVLVAGSALTAKAATALHEAMARKWS